MRDSGAGFHDGSSWRRNGDEMTEALAIEAQAMVRAAAQPIAPGETVKGQMRRAWSALGRPPMWRVRAAWYGEAGSWTAAAFEDLRNRYRAWSARQEAKGREEAGIAVTRLLALRDGLASSDSDVRGETLARLDDLLRGMGGAPGAGDVLGWRAGK